MTQNRYLRQSSLGNVDCKKCTYTPKLFLNEVLRCFFDGSLVKKYHVGGLTYTCSKILQEIMSWKDALRPAPCICITETKLEFVPFECYNS